MQQRWQQVQDIFWRVQPLDAAERERVLLDECGDDAGLLEEVRSLLAADQSSGILDAAQPLLAPLHDLWAEPAPQDVGPYRVIDEIGRGGMGVVFRAHDPRLQRDVALKFLSPGLQLHPAARERFIAEARTASALDHPNICTIYDIGEAADGRTFIAMAFYPHGTLAQRLDGAPLPLEEAVAIAQQVAAALEVAHQAGIVHRDIKPANIAFGERGEVKVLDFGVATLGDDAETALLTGGTPAYMAPEQVRGEPAGRCADLWALGLVLYEMLTGARAFTGANRDEVLHAIAHQPLTPVRALRPDLPAGVAHVLGRALERDPRARISSAREFADGLRAAVAPAPIVVRKRPRVLAAVAALALLLLTAVAALQLRGPRLGTNETAAIAVLPFANLTGEPENEHFADGITEDILTQLSRVPGLRVRSRTSVMRYKNTTDDIREIGETLDVPYVLEGSVRREGEHVRIAAQLIDARTDRHVWAETYDRRLTDLFLVQSEIARDIARALGARMTQSDVAQVPDASAYEQFLLGRERFHTRTREAVEEAIALLRSAVQRDSGFALAHAYLAQAYVRSIGPDFARVGQRIWLDSAQHHARHAIRLAAHMPDGYAALGAALNAAGRRPEAIAQLERALVADPNYALAMFELSRTHRIDYRYADAAIWIERALTVDPARSDYRGFAASLYQTLGMPEEGRRHVQAGLRLNPADVTLYWDALELELTAGDTAAAEQHLRSYLALRPTEHDRMMAWFEHMRGNNAAAKPYIDRIAAGTTVWYDLYTYGLVYRRVGETARGDSLIRRARDIARAGTASHAAAGPAGDFIRAQSAAANGDVAAALTHLEAWAGAGAVRSWHRLPRESVWDALREQPRFQAVVARTNQQLEQMRTRIRAQLAGAAPPR